MTALSKAKVFLQTNSPGDAKANELTDRIIGEFQHPKWEVRKSVAEALCYGAVTKSTDTLKLMVEDPVPYVRRAAEKSLREAKRVTTKVYEKPDPAAERLFGLIKKMNPRNIREAYAAALQVGQIYYRELAAITAHELRTSLFYLSGLIKELLDVKAEDSEETEAKLRGAMENLSRAVGGLSDLTRDPEVDEVFDVVPIVQQAITEANTSFRQDETAASVFAQSGHLSQARVKGDRLRLLAALRNLMLNALEASLPGNNVVVASETSEHSTLISIKDFGTGMTDQQIEDAFEPFSSSKREDGHSGMGIPIAQRVIHFDFGGELRFSSEVGKGTKALIEIPLYKGGA